jgi:hypothetical protein
LSLAPRARSSSSLRRRICPNPGDGAFHPFDETVVRAALRSVAFPMIKWAAEVFILPFSSSRWTSLRGGP